MMCLAQLTGWMALVYARRWRVLSMPLCGALGVPGVVYANVISVCVGYGGLVGYVGCWAGCFGRGGFVGWGDGVEVLSLVDGRWLLVFDFFSECVVGCAHFLGFVLGFMFHF